jgi:hypothetical protein
MFTAKIAGQPDDDEQDEPEPPPPPRSRSSAVRRGDDEDPPPRRASRASRDVDDDAEEDNKGRSRMRRLLDRQDEDEDEDDDDRRPRRRSRAEEEDDEDDDDNRPSRSKGNYSTVANGLNLIVIGGWLLMALVGLAVLGGLVFLLVGLSAAEMGRGGGGGGVLAGLAIGGCLAMVVGGLLFLGWYILTMIGSGMCMSTPPSRSSSARTLGISTFACYAAATVFYGLGFLVAFASAASASGPRGMGGPNVAMLNVGSLVQNFASLVWFAGSIVFLVYLRSVSLQAGKKEAARQATSLLIGTLIYYAATILVVMLAAVAICAGLAGSFNPNNPQAILGSSMIAVVFAVVVYAVLVVAALCMFVWYLRVVATVRDALNRA